MKMFLIKFLVFAGISSLAVTGISNSVVADSFERKLVSQANHRQTSEQKLKKNTQGITVKVLTGTLWGSGVLIKQEDSKNQINYTVVTNNHVLLQVKPPYLVQTNDGQTYKAELLDKFNNPDLALLQFTSIKKYPVASLKPAFTLATLQKGEEVFAAGYPVDASKGFVVKKGHIAALLPEAMSDGYQIGFSSDIVPGMSGGALLNRQGEVVGIIGKKSHPVNGFPKAYQFNNDFTPTLLPKDLMENSSWAIPIEIVVNKRYSELSGTLVWRTSPSSKTTIVPSNSSVRTRNMISEPQNSITIDQQNISNPSVDNDNQPNDGLKIHIKK